MNAAFVLSEEIAEALAARAPIVALETSVLAQGLPHPQNLEAAAAMSEAVRSGGAHPAWVWVDEGSLRIGASARDLERLATEGRASKVARRDLPLAVANGGPGATTVSATLWAADHARIPVMATGGIGGVHLESGDVSADLLEMARTPGTVICSGPKSIVDPGATLERLEELGIVVMGYGCDRLPFFLVHEAPFELEHRADSPAEVAAAAWASAGLGIRSALLVCNPVPAGEALAPGLVEDAVARCVARAQSEKVTGKAVTPFLLACVAERTGGASIRANLALLESNARLATAVAVALSALRD
jgi:pseudouridine-5'-phosphate glycosidase